MHNYVLFTLGMQVWKVIKNVKVFLKVFDVIKKQKINCILYISTLN